jgi:hypothetical protein
MREQKPFFHALLGLGLSYFPEKLKGLYLSDAVVSEPGRIHSVRDIVVKAKRDKEISIADSLFRELKWRERERERERERDSFGRVMRNQ